MENNLGPAMFTVFLLGCVISFIARILVTIPLPFEREYSVKEYIQHPENYKLEYVVYKGDTTNVIVTYLK